MLLIVDKITKKVISNHGTNSLFPDGNLPLKENENELFVKIHDDSDFAKQILSAYDYDLELNENNEITNVIVRKTIEQFQAEQSIEPPQPTELEVMTDYLVDVDFRLSLVELGLI